MRAATAAAAVIASLAATALPATAATPLHDTSSIAISFVDTETCGFPVVVDTVFTNAVIGFTDNDGVPTSLQLHQSLVGTWTAKGVTLKINVRELIIVEFENGIPVIAKHVGLLNSIVGPNGPVFLRTGQRVFEVVFDPVSGFYVDGPRIALHGVRADFDAAAVCAAFG